MSQQLEIVADERNKCGEGPVWDFRINRFIWNDLSSSLVFEHDPATKQTAVICRDPQASGITLNGAGGYVFGGGGGLHVWQRDGSYRTLATEFGGEDLSFNDIVAGPNGRVYAGTIYWGADGMIKPGKLFRFDPDGTISVLDEGIEMPNGLAFSPDDRTLYFSDSARRTIFAYDVDAGSGDVSNRRVFVTVPADEGLPDGHTVDAEGHLWSSQWYGSQVVRYDPDGKVERRVAVPAKQVASVAFGGEDMSDLYITTAGESEVGALVPPGYDESGNIGGALYRLRPGVQGRHEHISTLGQ